MGVEVYIQRMFKAFSTERKFTQQLPNAVRVFIFHSLTTVPLTVRQFAALLSYSVLCKSCLGETIRVALHLSMHDCIAIRWH